ncbi:hypothetical protein [Gilvimarinus xylanilyticus]|uniref:hypothetical protein n=1 Tax=Gilvimarinus xylanilyticus TaxID=2944139 RepID=UPI003AEFBB9F
MKFTNLLELLDTAKIQTLCAYCPTANRVDETRLRDTPKCGECGSPLFSGAPIAVSDVQFTRWAERERLPLVIDFWAS